MLAGMHENKTQLLQERREYQTAPLHKNYLTYKCERLK